MRKEYMPYYISRGILSLLFSMFALGTGSWMTLMWSLLLFGGFILYLHSGWFVIDLTNPWFPIRRDDRGKDTQRKALIAGVISSLLLFSVSSLSGVEALKHLALPIGIMTYFGVQFYLFSKT